jgi:hypothetical protein
MMNTAAGNFATLKNAVLAEVMAPTNHNSRATRMMLNAKPNAKMSCGYH